MAQTDSSKNMQELQMIEQNLQNVLMQKQNFQVQIAEIDSALKELEGKESAYKIVGNLLVESDAKTLVQELAGKKEVAELRLKSIEKQEAKLQEKAQSLQKEILGTMKD